MIVIRQWMTNSFKIASAYSRASVLILLPLTFACNPTEITSSGQRAGSSYDSAALVNKAFIYRESPAVIEGPKYGPKVDMGDFVDTDRPEFITFNSLLKGDCNIDFNGVLSSTAGCVHSYASKSASQQLLPRQANGNWIYNDNSAEFYQVNALYHVQQGVDTFFSKLKFAYENLHYNPAFTWQTKSIPKYLPTTKNYWFHAITPANVNYFRFDFLSSYALCNLELNASFSPAGPDLCFGKWDEHKSFLFVQDPSVIFHELGHALVSIMMNMRNGVPGTSGIEYHALRSNLGGLGYDEAGSINEGIADYFSFVMNKRTHIGEWALGKAMNASRPLSESDKAHISGISPTSEGRLSYPQYLLYNPNQPTLPQEGVHNAGQIVGHYLVALTKDIQTTCGLPKASAHDTSTSYVMMLLTETLSELGDLNAIGLDTSFGGPNDPLSFIHRFNNLDENASYTWTQVVNPPTYRRFFQVFSKNINKYLANGLCAQFSVDRSERLLDDYGLLLFKTYNDNNSSTTDKNIQHTASGYITTTPVPSLPVTESNRRKSVLVSKSLLSMATANTSTDTASYYLIDDQVNISKLLQNLLFKGYPMNPSTGISGVTYNNGNVRISPGEIVGIIPNLYNASNSTMAGVHLLANDWDHVQISDTEGDTGNFKPCVVDDVTTVAQGAESGLTCAKNYPTLKTYNRHIKRFDPVSGEMKFSKTEAVAPVCLVQLEEGEVTRWVSQNEFRKKQGLALQDKDCLGYAGTSKDEDFTFNPHECLVRVLPGANDAFYSKIDAQKTYKQTMTAGDPGHEFGSGNLIMFEVNKWIPPGTKFRCRLRANFSNCSDCFSDPSDTNPSLPGVQEDKDDYIDAEYNGAKPYKIINLEFDVND